MVYDSVFQPITIGNVTIPNRVARGAHNVGTPWVDESDDLIAYHEARAKGGVGLTFLGVAGVHRTSRSTIPVRDDSVIPGYQRLVERIRPHGMKLFQQLWHAGPARFFPPEQPWSASDTPNPFVGVPPRPMTKAMIDEIVESFAQSARRVKAGGLDGLEVHAAHGYLIAQFLSPATNHRDDDYGGSLDNRTRFLKEIIAAIRSEVGPEFPVGVRLSSDEQVEGGLTPPDTLDIVRSIESEIDFVDLSFSSYYRFHEIYTTMEAELAYETPYARPITREISVPTIVTGRIMTLDVADHVISSGDADMVSMVRPLVADPDLVRKTREGRAHEVRPCIGTNQGCVGKFFTTGRMSCSVNPLVTHESTASMDPDDVVTSPKRVMIVGAGPAGLEAARSLALRGHSVELFDMNRTPGGQVLIAASAPHRSDIGAITAWLSDEVNRLGVKVKLGSPIDPDFLLEARPDEVIIAAGSTPREDGFQSFAPARKLVGAQLPHVTTSWRLFGFGGRSATVGARAVVYDDCGSYEAISVAEKLVADGAKVTFVTRHEKIGATVDHTPSTVYSALERLFAAGTDVVPVATITEITPEAVEVSLMAGFGGKRTIPADTVVMVGYNEPNRGLADELIGAPFPVHVIGDATGSRTILDAIEQATELARSI